MKKYDLSKIMKRAWELVKKASMTISSGLKKAWKEAKAMINFEAIAKVAIVDKNGETNPNIGTDHDDASNYLTFNRREIEAKLKIPAKKHFLHPECHR